MLVYVLPWDTPWRCTNKKSLRCIAGTVFGACNGKSCRQMVVVGPYWEVRDGGDTTAVVGIAYTVGFRMVDVEAA